MNKSILVSSCPRGGSSYTTKFLQQCGKDVRHEKEGEDGIVSWLVTPTILDVYQVKQYRNFKVIRTPNKDHRLFRPFHWLCPVPSKEYKAEFKTNIHQIREPLKCINSMSSLMKATFRWTHNFIDYPAGDPPRGNLKARQRYRLRKQMYFWYYWNKMGIENADWYYRVEDFKEHKGRLCNEFEITSDQFDDAYSKTSKKTNTRASSRRSNLTWERLKKIDEEMCDKIYEFSKELKYV